MVNPFFSVVLGSQLSMRCKPRYRGSLPSLAHFWRVVQGELVSKKNLNSHLPNGFVRDFSVSLAIIDFFHDKGSLAPFIAKPTASKKLLKSCIYLERETIPANVNNPLNTIFFYLPSYTNFPLFILPLCWFTLTKKACILYILYCSQTARASASWLQLGEPTTGRVTHHQEFKGQLTGRKEKKAARQTPGTVNTAA